MEANMKRIGIGSEVKILDGKMYGTVGIVFQIISGRNLSEIGFNVHCKDGKDRLFFGKDLDLSIAQLREIRETYKTNF